MAVHAGPLAKELLGQRQHFDNIAALRGLLLQPFTQAPVFRDGLPFAHQLRGDRGPIVLHQDAGHARNKTTQKPKRV